MKNSIIAVAALVVTLTLIFMGGIGHDSLKPKDTLVLATDAGYAPFEVVDEQGNVVGFDIDVAEALAEGLGKKLKVVQAQFDSLILGLKKGKYDLIMAGFSITPQRRQEIALIPYHGEGVTHVTLAFWQHAPDGLNTLEEVPHVAGSTIAVLQGSWQEMLIRQLSGISPRSFATNTELIMEIKYGKSNAALFETHIFQVMQQQIPDLQGVTLSLPPGYDVGGVGIGINPMKEDLIQEVHQAVTELKATGRLTELEHKWFGGEHS